MNYKRRGIEIRPKYKQITYMLMTVLNLLRECYFFAYFVLSNNIKQFIKDEVSMIFKENDDDRDAYANSILREHRTRISLFFN